jgi:two-component system, sensor histidine kinase and response regulator
MQQCAEAKLDAPSVRGRVLVVDDENGPRQALRMLLNEDHEVMLAADVDAAQAILQTMKVDLVITDIRMPKRSGVELLQWVRRWYADVEVIILTGFGELESAMKAVAYGAFAYLEKPFDNTLMLQYVQQALLKRRQEKERRQLEELALEANRFETLGRFVSGMLHDLGTPLAVIGSQAEIVLESPNGDSVPRVEAIKVQAHLCNDIVRSAMSFLRHNTSRMTDVNINVLCSACLDVARPVLQREQVRVTMDCAEGLPPCEGDSCLLRQAVLNLITNACQAMEGQAPPCEIQLRSWCDDGMVCLSVGDTGPGVPEEHRSEVYDTFFSTKGEHGTGLGLAAVRNIVHRHGGEVALHENEGGGALFVLKFPANRPRKHA